MNFRYLNLITFVYLVFLGCASEPINPIDLNAHTLDSIQSHLQRIEDTAPPADTTISRINQTSKVISGMISKLMTEESLSDILMKQSLQSCFQEIWANEENRLSRLSCVSSSSGDLSSVLGHSVDIFKNTPTCQCRAWANCTKEQCGCDQLCPANLEVIVHKTKDLSNPSNHLSFTLSDPVFTEAGVESTAGYCWGHATVTQRFQRLADFDVKTPGPSAANEKAWILFYQKLINDIVINQKITIIPGFKNLYEFSEHPLIKKFLAARVSAQWKKEALSPEGVQSILPQGSFSKATLQEKINEIKTAVSLGLNPTLMIIPDEETDAHVVLVNSITEKSDGTVKMCFYDSNFNPKKHRSCLSFIEVLSDGTIFFHSGSRVSSIKKFFTTESDQRSLCLHLLENYSACRKKYQCDL